MLSERQKKVISLLVNQPLVVAKWLKFNKLTELHNEWMKGFITGKEDETLQAHRGSYKTTCVSIAIAIIMVLYPNKTIAFIRKTDTDVQEVIKQVRNILASEVMQYLGYIIYGRYFNFTDDNKTQLSIDLRDGKKGTVQLMGIGTGGSITGKHFDIIFTDDIVNAKDRVSPAERTATKLFYMELQNIINRGGRIVNTGTPWHKDDAFTLMPTAKRFDCYSTGLITKEELDKLRKGMSPALFAANYELKHIADKDALFKEEPKYFDDIKLIENGIAQIDASYGGADSSAYSAGKKVGENFYIYGKKRDMHIDDCLSEFISLTKMVKCGTIWCEDNGDKGYLKKEIVSLGGISQTYHESENKYNKIATFLKMNWSNVYFYRDTDPDFILQIMDYNEQAEHDDCPDSVASLIRQLSKNTFVIC